MPRRALVRDLVSEQVGRLPEVVLQAAQSQRGGLGRGHRENRRARGARYDPLSPARTIGHPRTSWAGESITKSRRSVILRSCALEAPQAGQVRPLEHPSARLSAAGGKPIPCDGPRAPCPRGGPSPSRLTLEPGDALPVAGRARARRTSGLVRRRDEQPNRRASFFSVITCLQIWRFSFVSQIPALRIGRPEYPFRSPGVTSTEWQTSPIPRISSLMVSPDRCCRGPGQSFGGKHGSVSSARLIH
jgi:hypothetical protein